MIENKNRQNKFAHYPQNPRPQADDQDQNVESVNIQVQNQNSKPSVSSKLNEYKNQGGEITQDHIDDKLSKLQGLLKMAKNQ